MRNEKFWIVWQPESGSPTYRHDSLEAATKEAERLAEATRTREFFVLEAVSVSKKVTVQTLSLEESGYPPF